MQRRVPPAARDLAPVMLLVPAGQVEVWLVDATATGAWLTLLGTAPVALWRSAPLTGLVIGTVPLWWLTLHRSEDFSFASLLSLLLLSYAVARSRPVGTAATGLVVALGGATTNSVSAPGVEPGDVLFPILLVGGPWAAGRAVRVWQQRAETMERLTVELRKERNQTARLAAAAERARIARDLHDSLAQVLQSVVVNAEAAEASLSGDGSQALASVRRVQQAGRQALDDAREAVGLLRHDDDHDHAVRSEGTDGLPGLATLLAGFADAGLTVRVRGTLETTSLPPAVEATAYRVAQEALTNVLRHAGADQADLYLACSGDHLRLEVTDRGQGPDSRPRSGFGLRGMAERVAALGGRLEHGPGRDGRGYVVRVALPLGAAR